MKYLSIFLLFIASLAAAQSSQRANLATQINAGNVVLAIPNASIYVCAYNSQLTCTGNYVSVFSDPALTVPLSMPFTADQYGFYSYYVTSGTQVVEKVCTIYMQCTSVGLTIGGSSAPLLTGVTAGTGLLGGGSVGNVTLSVNSAVVAFLGNANTFTQPQTAPSFIGAFVGTASAANSLIGNLPISNLANGSGASASTFWRGDGTWATPVGSLPSSVDTFDTIQVNGAGAASILTPTLSGTWEAVQNGGADNTGVSDASSILQTELNSLCSSANPTRVHLAAGIYTINSGILISATSSTCKGLVIEGDGANNTILQTNCSGNSYGVWYNNTTNSGEHFNGPAIRRLQIKGTGGTACTYGLRITQSAGWKTEDLIITGFSGQTYATGTISTSGSTVTGSGTTFTSAMVHGFIEITSLGFTYRGEVCAFNNSTTLTLCDAAFPTGNLASSTAYALAYGGAGLVCDPGFSYTQYGTIKDVYSSGNLIGILAMGSTTGGCSRISVDGKAGYIAPNPGARIPDSVGIWMGHGSDTWDINAPSNNEAVCWVADSAHAWKVRGDCENSTPYDIITTCNGGVALQSCTTGAEVTADTNGHGWNGVFDNAYFYNVGTVYQFDNNTGNYNAQILGDRTLTGQYTQHYNFFGTISTCPVAGQGVSTTIQTYDCSYSPIISNIPNTIIITGTTTINALSCTGLTITNMAGVSASSTSFTYPTPESDVSSVTGWGPGGTLYFVFYPTTNSFNWKVCNSSASSAVTPGSSITWNVAAR